MLKIIHFFSPHPYFQKIVERRFRKIGQLHQQAIVDAHENFLPNIILKKMHQREKIILKSIPTNTLANLDLRAHLDADIWLFSLMEYKVEKDITHDLLQSARELSKKHNIKLINSTSEPRYRNEIKKSDKFPLIAKPKGNGSILNEIKSNHFFQIIRNTNELETWWRSVPDSESSFTLEPYFCNETENSGIFLQERWICIFGDLTVGRQISKNRIIKYRNSITYFQRPICSLPEDLTIFEKSNHHLRELHHGYCNRLELWRKRQEKLDEFTSKRPDLQIFSLDVIFQNDEFNIVDSNEHSYTPGTESLMELWIHHIDQNFQLRIQDNPENKVNR